MIFIPISYNNEVKDNLEFDEGDILITGSADNTARVWSPEAGTTLRVRILRLLKNEILLQIVIFVILIIKLFLSKVILLFKFSFIKKMLKIS